MSCWWLLPRAPMRVSLCVCVHSSRVCVEVELGGVGLGVQAAELVWLTGRRRFCACSSNAGLTLSVPAHGGC
jgi:hypothetical protein